MWRRFVPVFVIAVLIAAPVIHFEYLYRFALWRAGGAPDLPDIPPVPEELQIAWVASYGMDRQRHGPIWLGTFGRRDYHPHNALTWFYVEPKPRSTFRRTALGIWISQNTSEVEAVSAEAHLAYFGNGVFGVDAAARDYLNKRLADVTLTEAATLTALTVRPSNRVHLKDWRDRILQRTYEAGHISYDELLLALSEPIPPSLY